MKDCFVLALLISTFPYEITNSLKTPVVRTPSGPVRGLILRTVWHSIKYSSFKGIPYAKPPLGDLRFKVWKKFYSIIPLFNWKFTKDFIQHIFDFFFCSLQFRQILGKECCTPTRRAACALNGITYRSSTWAARIACF